LIHLLIRVNLPNHIVNLYTTLSTCLQDAAAVEAAATKLSRKLEAKRLEIGKEAEAAVAAKELFKGTKHAAKFSPNALDAEVQLLYVFL